MILYRKRLENYQGGKTMAKEDKTKKEETEVKKRDNQRDQLWLQRRIAILNAKNTAIARRDVDRLRNLNKGVFGNA